MNKDYSMKKLIIISTGILMALMVFIFLLGHSFVIVQTPAKTEGLLISAQKEGSSDSGELSLGLNVLPQGSYTISLSQGISLTRKEVSLSPFRINKMSAELTPQQTLKKIARGANECVFGDSASLKAGTVYSYECIEPTTIFVNKYQEFSKKTVLVGDLLSTISQPQSYKNGLVGLIYGDAEPSLVFIDKDGQKTHTLSKDLGFSGESKYEVFAGTESLVLLDTKNKTIYSLANLGDKPQRIQLDTDKELSEGHTVIRQFEGGYYIFSGEVAGANSDSLEKGTFYIFKPGGGKPSKVINIEEHADELINFSVVSKDLIYSTSLDQKTTIFSLANNKLEEKISLESSYATAAKGSVYMIINQDVYRLNPQNNTLNLVFGSAKINVTRLQTVDKELVISGFSNTETDPINQTYVLESSPITSNSRLEEVLPYGNIDKPLAWMDYSENNIHVVLDLKSLRKDPGSGNYIFDQQEFNAAAQEIRKQLEADGLNGDKYNIGFSAY